MDSFLKLQTNSEPKVIGTIHLNSDRNIEITYIQSHDLVKRSLPLIQEVFDHISSEEDPRILSVLRPWNSGSLFIHLTQYKDQLVSIGTQTNNEKNRFILNQGIYMDISLFEMDISFNHQKSVLWIYTLGICFILALYSGRSHEESMRISLGALLKTKEMETIILGVKDLFKAYPIFDEDHTLQILLDEYPTCLNRSKKESSRRWIQYIHAYFRNQWIRSPYDRRAFRNAMKLEDTTARRDECYQVIRNFNRRIETANIHTVYYDLNERSRFLTTPYKLVVGRESRAFGNQAYLFANAKYVNVTPHILEQLNHLVASTDPVLLETALNPIQKDNLSTDMIASISKDIPTYSESILASLCHLQQAYHEKPVKYTQIHGAIDNFKESLKIYYRQCKNKVESVQQETFEEYEEGAIFIDITLFSNIRVILRNFFENIERAIDMLLKVTIEEKSNHAAFSVLLQRPSITGSERFKLNELVSKPEQEDALQKLTYYGGTHLHMSPSYEWIEHATDIIEAVPLFIYERTTVKDGIAETMFEVDQEGLEETIRVIANHWAQNIDNVFKTECMAIARRLYFSKHHEVSDMNQWRTCYPHLEDEVLQWNILKNQTNSDLEWSLAKLSCWIHSLYLENASQIEASIEISWKQFNFITRYDALSSFIDSHPFPDLKNITLDACQPFLSFVHMRRRLMPAFHLLTTEAPGLVDGFFVVVLEEEMALRNIIKANHLEAYVSHIEEQIKSYLCTVGAIIVDEFEYETLVQNEMDSGLNAFEAILKVLGQNKLLQEEVSRLSVLVEFFMASCQDKQPLHGLTNTHIHEIEKSQYAQYLSVEAVEEIHNQSVTEVWDKNLDDQEFKDLIGLFVKDQTQKHLSFEEKYTVLTTSAIYRKELNVMKKQRIRRHLIDILDTLYPSIGLKERAKRYYRDSSSLRSTTARRRCVCQHRLQHLLSDPRYAYTSGMVEENHGELRPTGVCKRFHLIYGPSRVNLGKDERKSVEQWSQFIGVRDPLAADHALSFYGLINFNPVVRNVQEAENLKVSENQWTALIRSVRNVQALFVERLGIGDIEDLTYHFNMRGGLAFGSLKEGEGYNAGPTAGYCIPKDLLFKLFVGTYKDEKKLGQIGVPAHLYEPVLKALAYISENRKNYDSALAFERWASDYLFNENNLESYMKLETNETESKYLEYIGTNTTFAPTHLSNILSHTGIPSLRMNTSKDMHPVLWSNWADQKITLGGEQVNRSVVFTMTREIFQSVALARKYNPFANIDKDEDLTIQMHGVYKGDDCHPPPPDVRYSWTMRAFQILSGHYEHVAESLDEEGQIIARLSWVGFHPYSKDPQDIRVNQYLARSVLGLSCLPLEDKDLLRRLELFFPEHKTVGDINITVVPGVDAEDLLGFSAETLTLLGEEADRAKSILIQHGMQEEQIEANARLHRRFPNEWFKDKPDKIESIQKAMGGAIHPLVLRSRGPGTRFIEDVQGRDVCVFSITHPDILQIDPSHLRDLMLTGKSNSAFVALDYVSQGRHRCWYDRDVMMWYAACRRIDALGYLNLDWSNSKDRRRAIYKSFGSSRHPYTPLLGTDLYEEVVRQEQRAARMFYAAQSVVSAKHKPHNLESTIQEYEHLLRYILQSSTIEKEMRILQEHVQRAQLANRLKKRDIHTLRAFEAMHQGLSIYQFDEVSWLALGGLFLINGTPKSHQKEILSTIREAQALVLMLREEHHESVDMDLRIAAMIVSTLPVDKTFLLETKGEMFSVKATEKSETRAITRRSQLALQSLFHTSRTSFEEGYSILFPLNNDMTSYLKEVHAILKLLEESETRLIKDTYFYYGRLMQVGQKAIKLLASHYVRDNALQQTLMTLSNQWKGEYLNMNTWDAFGGSYEDQGLLSILFECVEHEIMYAFVSILYTCLAVDKTVLFLVADGVRSHGQNIWRSLAEFFAKTIDDHFFEYNPWFLDPKRTPAFRLRYDVSGAIQEESRDWLYETSWRVHRHLYVYLRTIIVQCSDVKYMNHKECDALIGKVSIGETVEEDTMDTLPIGNEGYISSKWERLWRGYNQLRDITFMRNDGFALPVVMTNLNPSILNCENHVNMAILSPVGRTHYSRMLLEAQRIHDLIFITRSGLIEAEEGKILTILDAHFWMSKSQYELYLEKERQLTPVQVKEALDHYIETGLMTPKGIRVAAKFTKKIPIGVAICFHHHPLERELSILGYPSTDKSPFLFDMTYNKSLYPQIYNEMSGVDLPPQMDWLYLETQQFKTTHGEKGTLNIIEERVRDFSKQHGILIVKGAAESGARNLQRFDIQGSDGRFDEVVLKQCVQFIYNVSKSQNVTIQKAMISSPLLWMSEEAIQDFVQRQIEENGQSVQLSRHPKDFVYGSLRVIMSCGVPKLDTLHEKENWTPSHRIYLNSLQIATNVGRQGSLDILSPDMIHDDLRDSFIQDFEESARSVMSATSKFGPKYWNETIRLNDFESIPPFKERNPLVPEQDAIGIPTWWPRYLMIDLLPMPIFIDSDDNIIEDYQCIQDISQNRSVLLIDKYGMERVCRVYRFRFYLLEPNVGIGLWPNFWKREVVKEHKRSLSYHDRFEWDHVGQSDEVVLSHFIEAGRVFLKKKFRRSIPKLSRWSPPKSNDPIDILSYQVFHDMPTVPLDRWSVSIYLVELMYRYIKDQKECDLRSELIPIFEKIEFPYLSKRHVDMITHYMAIPEYRNRLVEHVKDRRRSQQMAPPIQIVYPFLEVSLNSKFFPHPYTFCVLSRNISLLNHQVYPFIVGRELFPFNMIAIVEDWWIPNTCYVKRALLYDATTHTFVDAPLEMPVAIDYVYIMECGGEDEVKHHRQLSEKMERVSVFVINPGNITQCQADNKLWIRENSSERVVKPKFMAIDHDFDDRQVSKFFTSTEKGIVIQPSYNTTESQHVVYMGPENPRIDVIDQINAMFTCFTAPILLSDFRGHFIYANQHIVFRVHVVRGCVTMAAIVGSEEIVSLKNGYCERLDIVLKNMRLKEHPKDPFIFHRKHWQSIHDCAMDIYWSSDLEILGIDFVMEYDARSDAMIPVLLEMNGRPGTLIFAEVPLFEGDLFVGSSFRAPMDDRFWRWLHTQQNPHDNSQKMQSAPHLYHMLLTRPVDASMLKNIPYLTPIHDRYDRLGYDGLRERWTQIHLLLESAVLNGFALDKPFTIVVSNGRDRYFGGHTDFDGLGGITINAANDGEIFGIFQALNNDTILLSNTDPKYPSVSIALEQIVKDAQKEVTQLYDVHAWDGYIKGALCYSLHDKYQYSKTIRTHLYDPSTQRWKGLRAHFQSQGRLALETGQGLSSSSALTLCFMQGLCHVNHIPMDLEALADVDYGEYFLGKTAGAADATTIVTSHQGDVSVISSFPNRRIQGLRMPDGLVVMMAQSNMPRLNSKKALEWLIEQGYSTNKAERIRLWASNTMKRFGSETYVVCVKTLLEMLESKTCEGFLTPWEIDTVRAIFQKSPYLRELCMGGLLEKEPRYHGWENRHERYQLIFKLLLLVPELVTRESMEWSLRKAMLYGISEVERAWRFVMAIENNEPLDTIIDLVRWCQDGDRAMVDYRKDFETTPWYANHRNFVDDIEINNWLRREYVELVDKPGGFQRSIPEFDELADDIHEKFGSKAAVRVSGAGLGGSLSVYVQEKYQEEVTCMLQSKGYKVRVIKPCPSLQILI